MNQRKRLSPWLEVAVSAWFAVAAVALGTVQADPGIQLIPQPVSVQTGSGRFQLSPGGLIGYDQQAAELAERLRHELAELTGLEPATAPLPSPGPQPFAIELRIDPELTGLGDEGYRLTISPEGVDLRAAAKPGLFYATRTLRQLLPIRRISGLPADLMDWVLPAVVIEDRPRFRWRGLMLDCSRTFLSVEYLKATLDRMAFFKLNVLHLHLTDDQGWRLEIRRYPKLTEFGARFPERWQEPETHQGYYSQDQIRDLVRYAAERNITLLPEIEMPGHALAALACYPELSCTGGPFEIHPFFKGPNIHQDIFCAGNDRTFEFLEGVLAEVMELFPSELIHIGGDEAPKHRWQACPKCQARIREQNLKDEDELQSWFLHRIERYVNARGRRIIGWDEILEGGLPPNAAVMSWRGMEGGTAAARAGHQVVMSPTSHCYFDYPYSQIDTRRAYDFEPVPEGLAEDQALHILGLQANFWSHIDREPDLVDRQLFPRLLAIAERGWSPREVRDWSDFAWRVKIHFAHLDEMGVAYHRE